MTVAIVLAWLVGCQPAPQLEPLQPGAALLALGDSLTFGTGVAPSHAYPAVLAELTGRTVINAGIAGEETAEAVQRLPALLQRYQPELVIIIHGGNDLLRHRDNESIRDNLAAMIRRIQAGASDAMLVSVPAPGLLLRPPKLYSSLAAEYRLPLEHHILGDLLANPAMKSDPVHLNELGYQRLAEAILAQMRDSGAL
jgi:lysophospholipase L1-like esterase